jgi:hypothetical protein
MGILYFAYPADEYSAMIPRKVILRSGPEDDSDWGEAAMRFRLTYEGPLRPSQTHPANSPKPEPLSEHKFKVRRQFHGQLKRLWETNRILTSYMVDPKKTADTLRHPAVPKLSSDDMFGVDEGSLITLHDSLYGQYRRNDFNFIPLVTERLQTLCSISILFLRRDNQVGSVFHKGDIDNRIKTLIDGLTMPGVPNQFGNNVPQAGEDPFYCLLEDDRLISHIDAEADVLLDPPKPGEIDDNWVRAIVTVELRPYFVTAHNLAFS